VMSSRLFLRKQQRDETRSNITHTMNVPQRQDAQDSVCEFSCLGYSKQVDSLIGVIALVMCISSFCVYSSHTQPIAAKQGSNHKARTNRMVKRFPKTGHAYIYFASWVLSRASSPSCRLVFAAPIDAPPAPSAIIALEWNALKQDIILRMHADSLFRYKKDT
jgi:hypothetical protein